MEECGSDFRFMLLHQVAGVLHRYETLFLVREEVIPEVPRLYYMWTVAELKPYQ